MISEDCKHCCDGAVPVHTGGVWGWIVCRYCDGQGYTEEPENEYEARGLHYEDPTESVSAYDLWPAKP